MVSRPTLRAIVADDSTYNRHAIAAILDSLPGVTVVGKAVSGQEALKLALLHEPDLITLDLEMPGMDGFAFLRLLMAKRPTPVIVVSGHSHRENVFRALELGALDFVAKPPPESGAELESIAHDLREKVEVVARLRAIRVLRPRSPSTPSVPAKESSDERASVVADSLAKSIERPVCVIAIGASTGGPPAIQRLVAQLPGSMRAAVVVAQHMPARFTTAFAQRLDRLSRVRVVEAEDGTDLMAGTVYIAPGSMNLLLERSSAAIRAHVVMPSIDESPVISPSVDVLMRSVAIQYGPRACALVLSGMGSDGRRGARAIHEARGMVMIEDPSSAVMPSMPQAVANAGIADVVASLDDLSAPLLNFISEWERRSPKEP